MEPPESFGWKDSSRGNGCRLREPRSSRGIEDGKGDRPASRGDGFQLFTTHHGFLGLFPPEGQQVVDAGAEIGETLFAGFALAIGLGKLSTDGGKAGFAVDGTVVKLDGQNHEIDFGAFYREGKDLPLLVNVNGVGGRFEVKGLIPPPA